MNAVTAARPVATSAPAPPPPAPVATSAAPVRAAVNSRAIGILALNPLPTTAGPVFQTMQVSLSANSQYLYINFTSYNTFNLNGSPSSAWPRVNFYLDLDNNPATGFQVNNGGSVGSEMLVQGQACTSKSKATSMRVRSALLSPSAQRTPTLSTWLSPSRLCAPSTPACLPCVW